VAQLVHEGEHADGDDEAQSERRILAVQPGEEE
jgi:hypothetical protein